ncbi:MAG: hypothetical protein ABI723_22465 [Bacteroidia bacterium]
MRNNCKYYKQQSGILLFFAFFYCCQHSVGQNVNIDSLFNLYCKDSVISFSFKNHVTDTNQCKSYLKLAVKDFFEGKYHIPDYYYLRSEDYNWPANKRWFAFLPNHTFTNLFQEKCNCTTYNFSGDLTLDHRLFYDKFIDVKLQDKLGKNYMIEIQELADSLDKNNLGFIEARCTMGDSSVTTLFSKCFEQKNIPELYKSFMIVLNIDLQGEIQKSTFAVEEGYEYKVNKNPPIKLKCFIKTSFKLTPILPAKYKGNAVEDDIFLFFNLQDKAVHID